MDKLITKYIKPNTKYVGKEIIYFDEIDSTNTVAKQTACDNGTVFIADCQTNGRGRMGKTWMSERGAGIWMSIVVMPEISVDRVMQISLITGIAVCEAVSDMYGIDAKIKWPNDIVAGDKKLCGILTEANVENNTVTKIINGIGINVNTDKFPDEIKDIATSVYMITGKKTDRADMVCRILENFEKYYNMLIDGDKLPKILKLYEKLCANIGRRVVSVGKNKTFEGYATGISPKGELIIETDDSKKITVNSGEVSVRGIYGYI